MRTDSRLRRARLPAVATTAGLLLVVPALLAPAPATAQDGQPQAIAVDTSADLPGMVRFSATDAQPMGMDEAEVKKALKVMEHPLEEMDRADFLWDYGFTFMTPRHERACAEFWLSKYEITNAQWAVFLGAKLNEASYQTPNEMTLKELVAFFYQRDAESNPVDAQSAGLYLFHRNAEILEKALNPDGDEQWEPLLAWVTDQKIPAGTTLEFGRIPPPSYWSNQGELPDDQRDLPVSGVSWADARKFCHWAGLHLPREVEWERGARGDEGRRFVSTNNWDPAAFVFKDWPGYSGEPAVQPVNSLADHTTPQGLHHMSGNVSEYVFDFARIYPGSKSKFKFNNMGLLARGGSYVDEPYVMLAADRIWDMGSTQIGPDSRADTFGFRAAGYPQAGCDLAMELAEFATEHDRMGGAAHWLPYPVGFTAKENTKPAKRLPFQGFGLDRTAGWMERQIDPNAAHFAYVTGPAKGIALLPIKGVTNKYMKNVNAFKKWSLAEGETAFVGALVTAAGATVTLQDEAGEPVTFDMSDINTDAWADHELGFTYQVGLWLVLRGDKVAVFGGNGSQSGVNGKHLSGTPIGYLPTNWEAEWAITADARPEATLTEGVVKFAVPIPQLDKDGNPKKGGKATLLRVAVPVSFE